MAVGKMHYRQLLSQMLLKEFGSTKMSDLLQEDGSKVMNKENTENSMSHCDMSVGKRGLKKNSSQSGTINHFTSMRRALPV